MNFVPTEPSPGTKIPRLPVTCDVDGRSYRGSYWIAGKILTVATPRGGHSRQVGSMPHEALARSLLEDLARKGKA